MTAEERAKKLVATIRDKLNTTRTYAGLYVILFNEIQQAMDQARKEGFEQAREMAAHKVQSFKWSTDNDSDVIEILAHRIRALRPPREVSGE